MLLTETPKPQRGGDDVQTISTDSQLKQSVGNELDRAQRYRNYAEELRVILADGLFPEAQPLLQATAVDYDNGGQP